MIKSIEFKYLLLLFIIMILLVKVNAGTPGWQVNSSDYSNSMSITGVLKLDGTESTDVNDQVAAFVNGECRGVSSLTYLPSVDRYEVFLLIYSNASSGEEITFKAYDADQDLEVDLVNKKDFVIDEIRGSISNPYIFTNTTPENDILSFEFSGVNTIIAIDESAHTVHVKVPLGTDLSDLVSVFELSEGSIAFVNNAEQESSVSSNDFTGTVTYVITALDKTSQSWTVSVEQSNEVTGFLNRRQNGNFKIYPVPAGEKIFLDMPEVENAKVSVLDSKGLILLQCVVTDILSSGMDISGLTSGVYTLLVETDNETGSQIFIKQ